MRKLWVSLAGLGLVVVLALHTLPYVVRDQLVLWLYQQGVEDARLRTLSINWWRGQLKLEKLSLQRQGYTSLQLEQLLLDVDLAALLDKRLLVENFTLTGLHGGLSDADGQLWLGPLALPVNAEPEPETTPAEPTAWQVGLKALTIHDLAWLTHWQGQQYPLQIDQAQIESLYQWAPLTDTLLTLQGRLNNAALVLDSTSQPLKPEPQFNLSLKLDRLPLDGVMAMLEQPLRGQLSSDLKIEAQLNPLQVNTQGTLGLDTLAWQAAPRADVGSVRWSGEAGWSGADEKATFAGSLNLKGTVVDVPDQLAAKLASLGWKGRGAVSLAKGLDGSLDGSLVLKQLTGRSADKAAGQSLQLEQAAWRGQASFAQLQDKPLMVNSQQQLTLAGLGATHQALVASLASLENKSQFELKGEQWQLTQPELLLKGLKADSGDYPLVSAEQIQLQTLQASADSARLATVDLHELKLASVVGDDQERPVSYWPQLKLANIHWQPQQLVVNSIELNGGETRLRRGAEGELTDIVALQQQLAMLAPAEGESAAAPADNAESPAMQVRLGELSVRKPHQLFFSDRSVKPRFAINGELSQLSVGPYDTQGKRPTDLNLKAKVNGDGELSLHGVLDTATMQSGGWTLDLNGVEMPYLSPYSMEYTGYFLQSGQLNLTSKGTLKGGQLEGSSTVKLHNFNVEPRQQDKVGQVSQRLSMPLETAVMVLEDDDSNIELDLDLSGSLDDPNFGYQSVINSLAGRGLKNAAVSYLTKSLQPYATLVSLAKTAIEANEKGTFISLQPVQFKPGKSALSKDMQGYMGKLTEMMAERPAMRLKLCGNAVKADLKVLQPVLAKENAKRKKPRKPEALAELLEQRLQTLAVQRGEVVKKQLAKGVPKERLFICYPTVDSSSDKPPSLSVGI